MKTREFLLQVWFVIENPFNVNLFSPQRVYHNRLGMGSSPPHTFFVPIKFSNYHSVCLAHTCFSRFLELHISVLVNYSEETSRLFWQKHWQLSESSSFRT